MVATCTISDCIGGYLSATPSTGFKSQTSEMTPGTSTQNGCHCFCLQATLKFRSSWSLKDDYREIKFSMIECNISIIIGVNINTVFWRKLKLFLALSRFSLKMSRLFCVFRVGKIAICSASSGTRTTLQPVSSALQSCKFVKWCVFCLF